MSLALRVATLGGVGRLRPGPGTWGSAAVLPAVWLGPSACLWLALLLAVLGWWAGTQLLAGRGDDPDWFVADEGAGMLLVLGTLPDPGFWAVALAFLLFRLFDIWKPWPVSWADRRGGATGVMLDDLLAGALAALALHLLGVP